MPQLLSTAEAASFLGITRRQLYRHIVSGELRVLRLGRRGSYRIPVAELRRFVTDNDYARTEDHR